MTEWRPVVGYEGLYEVSSDGEILNARRGRLRAQFVGNAGYLLIHLSKGGTSRTHAVHRLVAEAFHGASEFPVVRHRNDVKTDNRASNLAWATQSENIFDTVRSGSHRQTRKTECPQGHPYDPANTTVGKDGQRRCRACRAARERIRRRRIRERSQEA